MTIFNLFSLLGGLSMFLFGMSIMGEGLEKRAGSRMTAILAQLTSSPLRGFLLGLGVTAVIQSSSATTVMVVGLVNSGIMELRQAINVIMGANVGTTVTAWILSLTGLQGDSFVIQMLKPASFTPLLALWGIGLHMFSKKAKRKDTGTVLLGFAVLMFGMETMTAAVKPLAEIPQFAQILLLFSNPILGVLAGALITGIIQSSSASVGILQALSATGNVTYGTAIPIIMGQNIGTCVTALLSSVGTTKNARRAAVVHLYFNIIGTVVWLSVYSVLNAVLKFEFTSWSATPAGIAIVHTSFNVLCTAVMLPLAGRLEKLAYLTVKDNEEPEVLQLLDDRLLSTPSIAIERSKKLTQEMAYLARKAFANAITMLSAYDEKTAQEIHAAEERVDQFEDKLGTYLVKLSSKSLSFSDSREISKLLHSIGDFERISDHAVNVLEAAQEIRDKKLSFSDEANREMRVAMDAVLEVLDLAIDAFIRDDVQTAELVEPLEQVVDDLKNELKRRHVQRLQQGECTIELGFVFSDLLTNFERVSDHCSNIAVAIIELSHDSFDTHEYLHEVKSGSNKEFIEQYNAFSRKYTLP